ncbi:F-box protein At5g07610-like [Mercurialis annua]|uniref:F-box protein At5g07610-like n=1 Tax=Mercurialis annua TaxID=3986 RepID=UPI00215F8508|nr:F-box protein At5g07610-like [Mercurialis annua]
MVSDKRTKMMFSLSHSLSAEKIANNDDLLTEILLLLPIKSLFKFKCVSKNWLFLISNPDFHHRLNLSDFPCALFVHRLPFSNNPLFDFIKLDSSYSEAPFERLNFANDLFGIDIINSCNGLLLCSSTQRYSSQARYYIYNPTTKQHTVLPPVSQVDDESYSLHLAFDPSKSRHYKVICVRQYIVSEPHYNIEIYSSETRLWRVTAASFTVDSLDNEVAGGAFWNGAIHWITDWGPCFYLDEEQEQIREMPMPPKPDDWNRRRVMYFQESRGYLNLIEIYQHAATQFNVCELKKDYSRWFVKYRVDLGVIRSFPEMIKTELEPTVLNYYAYQIWSIVRGKNDEDSYMVLHLPAKIVRYNLKDGSFKKLCNFTPGKGATKYKQENAMNLKYYRAYEYIKSLATV